MLGAFSLCKKNIRARCLLMVKYIPRSEQSLCAAKNDQSLDSAGSKKGRVSPFYRATLLVASCLAPAKFEQRNVRIGLRN